MDIPTINSTPNLTTNIPSITVPKVNASMFTGTIKDITDQLISSASTIISTITAPLSATYNVIDTMYQTYDTTLSTANAALITARITMPGTVAKLQKEIERASTYKAKVGTIKKTLDDAMIKVQTYIDEGQKIVSDTTHHSIQWIEDKINWVLEKIFGFVQKTLDKVTTGLNKLTDGAKKKAEQEAEKLQAKLEAKAKAKAEQIAERQKKQQEQKAKNQQAIAKA